MIGPLAPTGTVLGDALEALGSAVAAVRRRRGSLVAPTALAMIIASGLLHPLRT